MQHLLRKQFIGRRRSHGPWG